METPHFSGANGGFSLLSAPKNNYVFFPNSDFPGLGFHLQAQARSTLRLWIWPLSLGTLDAPITLRIVLP